MKQRKLQRKQRRNDPRDGSQRSKEGPNTRIDPQHKRPQMGEEGEGQTGCSVWKPYPATRVGTEQLPWEIAESNELGKKWVDTARAESHSPTVPWRERERTRGRSNKSSRDSSGGRKVSTSNC